MPHLWVIWLGCLKKITELSEFRRLDFKSAVHVL